MPRTPDFALVGAGLGWVLLFTTPAVAADTWVLWARTCDGQSQTCDGKWQRGQTFEAERWCRAARTLAVNEALTPEGRTAAYARGTVMEYQCLPDTEAPGGPTKSK
jgi:hypothetical protein